MRKSDHESQENGNSLFDGKADNGTRVAYPRLLTTRDCGYHGNNKVEHKHP